MKKIILLCVICVSFFSCSSEYKSMTKVEKKEHRKENWKHLGGNVLGVTAVVTYAKVMGKIADDCKSCK